MLDNYKVSMKTKYTSSVLVDAIRNGPAFELCLTLDVIVYDLGQWILIGGKYEYRLGPAPASGEPYVTKECNFGYVCYF